MFPTLFKIGSFEVGSYGVMMAIGAFVSISLAAKDAPRIGLDKDRFYNFALYILLCAIAGARLLYVIVEWEYFVHHPLEIVFSREGFVFFGGLMAGFFAGFWYTRRLGLSSGEVANFLAPFIPLGHAFGRIGCFLNGCCHGGVTQGCLGAPIVGLQGRYFPIQLVSSVYLFSLFGLLYWWRKKVKTPWALFLVYLLLYSAGRFVIEFFRADIRGSLFGIFSTSQEISLFIFFISGTCLLFLKPPKESNESK